MIAASFFEEHYEINPELAVLDILERTLESTEKILRAIYPDLNNQEGSKEDKWDREQMIWASNLISRTHSLEESIKGYRNSLVNLFCPMPPEFDEECYGIDEQIPF